MRGNCNSLRAPYQYGPHVEVKAGLLGKSPCETAQEQHALKGSIVQVSTFCVHSIRRANHTRHMFGDPSEPIAGLLLPCTTVHEEAAQAQKPRRGWCCRGKRQNENTTQAARKHVEPSPGHPGIVLEQNESPFQMHGLMKKSSPHYSSQSSVLRLRWSWMIAFRNWFKASSTYLLRPPKLSSLLTRFYVIRKMHEDALLAHEDHSNPLPTRKLGRSRTV